MSIAAGIFKRGGIVYPMVLPNAAHDWPNARREAMIGVNADVDAAEDIWNYGGSYTFLAAASNIYLSSSAAADTGIQVKVFGLDANWALQNETISTDAEDGRTFVLLANQYIRIHRAYVSGGTAPAGDLYISSDNTDAGGDGIPDVTTAIKAFVAIGDNASLMAIYSIPAGYTGYMLGYRAGLAGAIGATARDADIVFQLREFGGVFRVREFSALISSGHSRIDHTYQVAEPVPAKADLKIRCSRVSAANTEIVATFELLLLPDST